MIEETKNIIKGLSIDKYNNYFLFESIYNDIENNEIMEKVNNFIKLLNSERREEILNMDFETEVWNLI